MPRPGPLTVMQVIASKGNTIGGAEIFYLRLLDRLQQKGVAVVPVVRRGTWVEAELKRLGTPHHALRFGGWLDVLTPWQLRRLVAATQPDLVQTWMTRATQKMPTPKAPWVARLGGYYPLRHYRRATHLVGNTLGLQQYFINQGWPAARTSYISNFVDLPPPDFQTQRQAQRAALHVPTGATVLLSSSRLHPHKAIETVLHAMAQLPPQVFYLVVNKGPEEGRLRQLAASLGVAARVRWLGHVTPLAPVAAAADIFVVPSRVEPLGNVVLDAWAHQLPLVCSTAAGPQELVQEGVTGIFFPIDDVAALAKQIQRLLQQPALAARLGRQGHAQLLADFAEEKIVDQYLQLYHHLAEINHHEPV